jgi:predicted secreted protein
MTLGRISGVVVAVAVAVALMSCGDGDTGSTSASTPQRFNDPQGAIDVVAGSEFEIALDATPGTGYSWKLAKPLNGAPVDYVGQKFTPDSGSQGTPGAGGTAILSFNAVAPGETTISLEYVGPGTNAPIGERRSIPVTVG